MPASRLNTPSPLQIAIVGGGPAGLVMGVLLSQHDIPFTIFEARQKPTEEELATPSGMLDLHEESGLTVIKECGLYQDFVPLTGECSEDFIVADRDGTILHVNKGSRARPEISRNNLTKLLMSNVPIERILWGHKLVSATTLHESGSIKTELDFGSHGKHTFDLVVGADGAWSKVRNLLTDTKPHYTGMQLITVTIREITRKYPHLAKLVGSGSFVSLGNRHAVISQRGTIDSSRTFLWLSIPDEDFASASGLDSVPARLARDKIVGDSAILGTFGTIIKELVTTACDEESLDNPESNLDVRALYSLPHGNSWEHKPGVTIVGDAAHLMLPNGEGVNFAMFDSFLLSQAIIKAIKAARGDPNAFQTVFDPLLVEFETAVVERATEVGKKTEGMIGKMFASNAAHDFAQFFKDMASQAGSD
jgi:2-polyprenyl-6-methoxyphenol hydroxylase-like FAD-dependent oxidoreductase